MGMNMVRSSVGTANVYVVADDKLEQCMYHFLGTLERVEINVSGGEPNWFSPDLPPDERLVTVDLRIVNAHVVFQYDATDEPQVHALPLTVQKALPLPGGRNDCKGTPPREIDVRNTGD